MQQPGVSAIHDLHVDPADSLILLDGTSGAPKEVFLSKVPDAKLGEGWCNCGATNAQLIMVLFSGHPEATAIYGLLLALLERLIDGQKLKLND